MNLKTIFFLLFLFSSASLWSQKFQVEIAGGVEFGWWVHELGSENPAVFNDLGVTKSHHSPAPFLSSSFLWKWKKWKVGPSVQGGTFIETTLRRPGDSRQDWDRIRIAEVDGSVPIFRYGLHLEYELFRRGNYSFVPAFRYGAFQWSTLHPDQANFGYKHFREIIFYNVWHLRKRDLFFRMNYDTLRIFLKEKANPLERHHLYFWGVSIGIRI